ncbi:Secreted protein containing DUF1598 [Planctomycetales bacterium 10988]|nr:Secreted protein containing DUF1598 [Planctomycetales bacterium 10988]
MNLRTISLRMIPLSLAICCFLSTGTVQAQGFAGVAVDADGVLRTHQIPDPHGRLRHQRMSAAQASLDQDIAKFSSLRKISLTRLEQAIEKCIEEGREPTQEMQHLAGLQRIQYLFAYPESGDLVIAGPAEGWYHDGANRALGLSTHDPVMLLEDMVVAMRAFPPGGEQTPLVGCSIDPTTEGLQRMQQFIMRVGHTATPAQTQFIVNGLRQSLGLQTVSIWGIPGGTHFAQVMVEADYRMKLIGIGLEEPPVRMSSYVDLVNPTQVASNALQRWYFVPDYECVKVSHNGQAAELVGRGVKLIGEDELVAADGQRVSNRNTNSASGRFVQGFTAKYPQIAERSPVYAQLRNLIDMLVAAAYMQQQDLYGEVEWEPLVFAHEKLFETQKYNTPAQVESAVNSLWKGRTLMTPVGGGVEITAYKALSEGNLMMDEDGKLESQHQQITPNLQAGQWWWD